MLQLPRFRHRGDDPILTLSEHLLHTAFCLLHISLFAQGNGKKPTLCIAMSELQYRLGCFTVHWFHLLRDWLLFDFITSVLLWSIKKTDTDLSDFQAFASFTKSTNPQIHEFASPYIYKSTSQSSYFGVPPTPHCMLPTAFFTLYQERTKRLALCTALPVLGALWYGPLLHSVDR